MIWQPQSPLYLLNAQWSPLLLLALALGIFLGLWGRRLFNIYRSQVAPGQVLRHRAIHAVLHWLNALGFILALISGAILLKWISGPGEITTYIMHFIGSTLVLFSIGTVVIYSFTHEPGRHRIRISHRDLVQLRQELTAYAGVSGKGGFLGYSTLKWPGRKSSKPVEPIKQDETTVREKYLATERLISYPLWTIIAGALIVTGVIKALHYITGMPDSLLLVATTIHDWAAWAAPVMLVFHAGAVIVIKSNWPLLRSMFTLTVPEEFGRKE
ncbi:MAG: cytochrome b/b6 domain-containing protein [Desulfitobacteriaceae bacterium]